MDLNLKKTIMVGVFVALAIASAVVLYTFHTQPDSVNRELLTFSSSIPGISLANENALDSLLSVFDSVSISITSTEIPYPMFVQNNITGEALIQSLYSINGNVLSVFIYASPELITHSGGELPLWLDTQFVKTASHAIDRAMVPFEVETLSKNSIFIMQ